MARPKAGQGDGTPDRVRIATSLTKARVNNYYRVLNMSKDTWMKRFTATQRYETVLDDLLNKLADSNSLIDELEGEDD